MSSGLRRQKVAFLSGASGPVQFNSVEMLWRVLKRLLMLLNPHKWPNENKSAPKFLHRTFWGMKTQRSASP